MKKEMLINALQPEETRIAVIEDGNLEELYVERDSQEDLVGNIYKGKVVNLEPSIQAAFVDFGVGRNGFLHISDVEAQYFPDFKPDYEDDPRGRRKPRNERSVRNKPPIQDVFKRGSEVLVQVIKEGIGTKGPTLSTYISIPGRYLVLMPGLQRVGVSRKIEDEEERRELKRILRDIDPPKGLGFIIRTAGVGRSAEDLQRDLDYLVRLWKRIVKRIEEKPAPVDVYEESDVILRTIRDIYSADIDTIWIDEEKAFKEARDFMRVIMPNHVDRVKKYDKSDPMLHHYKVESQIDRAQSRKVPLPGGGSIVIDQTEALVAIDVNSGTYRSADRDSETTAFEVNLEAAEEIARQLRLRDIGGVVVNDFIDMRSDRHRRKVEKTLARALERDRARTKVLRISPFGLVEMTRQRIRPSLRKSVYDQCPCCHGLGHVKTAESIAIEAVRVVMTTASNSGVSDVEVEVHRKAAEFLSNEKRRALTELEEEYEVSIKISSRTDVGPEHLVVRAKDDIGRELPKFTVDHSHLF